MEEAQWTWHWVGHVGFWFSFPGFSIAPRWPQQHLTQHHFWGQECGLRWCLCSESVTWLLGCLLSYRLGQKSLFPRAWGDWWGLLNCSNSMQAGEPLLKGRLESSHHTARELPTEAEKNNSLLRQKIMLTHSQSWRWWLNTFTVFYWLEKKHVPLLPTGSGVDRLTWRCGRPSYIQGCEFKRWVWLEFNSKSVGHQ